MFICVLQLMFVPKIRAMRKLLFSTNGGIIFKIQPLANLEDEIFLKGGSVVTPKIFGLIFIY